MAKKSTERRLVNIGEVVEKDLDYTKKYRYADIRINSSNTDLCYLIFHLDSLSRDYKININEVLLLVYLYELGVFSGTIEFEGRLVRVIGLERYGFIEIDYSHNGKKLYSLSAKGIMFVKDFSKRISNSEHLIHRNRKAIMDDDSRAKAVISRYFDE